MFIGSRPLIVHIHLPNAHWIFEDSQSKKIHDNRNILSERATGKYINLKYKWIYFSETKK